MVSVFYVVKWGFTVMEVVMCGIKGNEEYLEYFCMSEEIKGRWLNVLFSNIESFFEFR